ncbi:MAG: 2-oxo acid dehydrogenase subunit E2, partial [Chloroflexota bacterium]|nr:2-oxo acid dehydrogenase subunit E2 [Chloroflexota bacterium]
MPEQVIMPRLSDTMTDGAVAKWLKRPGDQVKKGEPLVEIETDKANIELEAYASGTLARIILPEGQSAPVGDVIGEIALPGEPLEAAAPSQPAPSAHVAAAPAAPEKPAAAGPPPAPPSAAPEPAAEEAGGLRASPMARRVARELGVDLAGVRGSGPMGRIQREDVEAVLKQAAIAAPPAAAPPPPPAVPRTPALVEAEAVPMTRIQQTIARRMVEAKTTVPHFYVSMEADMQLAVQVLEGLNEGVAKEERITINDLILKACALSLKEFPEVNASYRDGQLYAYQRVHVGFAVSVPRGLLVPVVRDVDRKNLR